MTRNMVKQSDVDEITEDAGDKLCTLFEGLLERFVACTTDEERERVMSGAHAALDGLETVTLDKIRSLPTYSELDDEVA